MGKKNDEINSKPYREVILNSVNKVGGVCGPAIRNYLMKNSWLNINKSDEQSAIYYQTEALCAGLQIMHNYQLLKSQNKSDKDINNGVFINSDLNPKTGIKQIIENCKTFPKEWTVLQVSKSFNTKNICSSSKSILSENSTVHIVLFVYKRWELNHYEPILIELHPSDEVENIFARSHNLNGMIKDKSSYQNDENEVADKSKYWQYMSQLETYITQLIDDIKTWLGPWICLFTGKLCTAEYKELETKIYEQVDDFCDQNQLSQQQRILICLIARRLDLVQPKDIYKACCHIIPDSSQVLKNLYLLFILLKSYFKNISELPEGPCIVILDELLDTFPWEMVNKPVEFCRISSFKILVNLYEKWKSQMRDGYLNVSCLNGKILLNPEQNLPVMEKRMSLFFEYWFPKWSIYKNVTENNFKSLITNSEIFVYCGHGSGLQFLSGDQIPELNVNAIVFLFGCESVKLFSSGLYSELCGSHLFYHMAQCPTIIGANTIITDFCTDKLSTSILSSWIPSKVENKWTNVNMKLWHNGELNFKSKGAKNDMSYEPNLLKILSQHRTSTEYNVRLRAALIYRGLPVISSASH